MSRRDKFLAEQEKQLGVFTEIRDRVEEAFQSGLVQDLFKQMKTPPDDGMFNSHEVTRAFMSYVKSNPSKVGEHNLLHYAAAANNSEIVRFLVDDMGADVDVIHEGRTALEANLNENVFRSNEELECARILLKAGRFDKDKIDRLASFCDSIIEADYDCEPLIAFYEGDLAFKYQEITGEEIPGMAMEIDKTASQTDGMQVQEAAKSAPKIYGESRILGNLLEQEIRDELDDTKETLESIFKDNDRDRDEDMLYLKKLFDLMAMPHDVRKVHKYDSTKKSILTEIFKKVVKSYPARIAEFNLVFNAAATDNFELLDFLVKKMGDDFAKPVHKDPEGRNELERYLSDHENSIHCAEVMLEAGKFTKTQIEDLVSFCASIIEKESECQTLRDFYNSSLAVKYQEITGEEIPGLEGEKSMETDEPAGRSSPTSGMRVKGELQVKGESEGQGGAVQSASIRGRF